jgi:chorismate lyase/3-hydroxybenzoate synthase
MTLAEDSPAHAGNGQHLLAAIGFAGKAAVLDDARPVFNIGLPLLAGKPQTEYWFSAVPVNYGKHASITYSHNGTVLFGHLLLEEGDFPDFRIASQVAYQHVFELLQGMGYPCLLRMWNYFPAITVQQGELNRYQTFCLGRQDALDTFGNFGYSPPAATAIGTAQAGLQLYFIAAKSAGMQLENPRQTSAFLYPRQYGPVSPAFSRATVKDWGQGKHIYISGTTSIVGHETLHVGDPLAQLEETLCNLEALLGHGDDTLGLPIRAVRELTQLKVYVHDPVSLPLLQARLTAYLAGSKASVLYLQGDVCRADLMVEMEGIYA